DDDAPRLARLHMSRGGARGRENAVQVDLDDPIPAIVAVILEGALGDPIAMRAHPGSNEPNARIDARVSAHYIEAPVFARCFVYRGIERFVVGHVDCLAPDIQSSAAQPPGLALDPLRIDIKHGDAHSVGRQRHGETQPDAARSAGHDRTVAIYIEELGDLLHVTYPRNRLGRLCAQGRALAIVDLSSKFVNDACKPGSPCFEGVVPMQVDARGALPAPGSFPGRRQE